MCYCEDRLEIKKLGQTVQQCFLLASVIKLIASKSQATRSSTSLLVDAVFFPNHVKPWSPS